MEDVAALGGCIRLDELHLAFTRVADISGLGSCTALSMLDLGFSQVDDITALAACIGLQRLNLNYCTKVCRSRRIETAPVSPEHFDRTSPRLFAARSSSSTTDLIPLCPRMRALANSQVADVSALAACTRLNILDLSHTPVEDISGLGFCERLQSLSLQATPVANVTPLGRLTRLEALNLRETKVADISALETCSRLSTLDLVETLIMDVSPLAPNRSDLMDAGLGEKGDGPSAVLPAMPLDRPDRTNTMLDGIHINYLELGPGRHALLRELQV